MILCHYLVAILLVSNVALNDALNELDRNRSTPLAECCSHWPDSNGCHLNGQNSTAEWLQLPPIYSATNETVNLARFTRTAHNSTCPAGYKSQMSAHFHLLADGSANVQGRVLPPNEFCLDQTLEAEVIVRYCVPDACSRTHCVRKCCPTGRVLNLTSLECDRHGDQAFRFVFHDRSGQVVEPDAGSYIVQDTDPLECPNNTGTREPLTSRTRMYSVSPEENADDLFYILADGQLFFPNFPEGSQTSKDYCVDDFLVDDDIVRQALICFPAQPTETEDIQLVVKVFPYFLFFSSLFLVATFAVYASVRELRNIHGVTVMCYVASLAVMYIGLGINQLRTEESSSCIYIAVIVHYTFLSAFSWLSVFSFDIWRTFSDLRLPPSRNGRYQLGSRFIFYSIYAWSVPFVIVAVGQILDYHVKDLPSHIVTPQFNGVKCWFNGNAATWTYLYGPIAIWILCNITFFVMTAVILHRAKKDTAFAAKSVHAKQNLFILMGVTWITEVASFAIGGSAYFWIPTDILNILTGVFIFIIFVCKPNVWNLLKLKLPSIKVLGRCCPSRLKGRHESQQTTST